MDSYELFLLSLYTLTYSYALPVVIIFLERSRQPIVYKGLAACLLFSFLTEITAQTLHWFGLNPNIAGNLYTLLSTIVITFFFYHAIQWESLKRPLILTNIIYLAFALLNLFFIQKSGPNSYAYTFQSIIIIVLSITFFFKLLKELPTFQVQKDPLFWIVSGFLFSYAGKLVIQSVTHYLIHIAKDNLEIVWTMHNFLAIIGCLIMAYGAYVKVRQVKNPTVI
jgi:hypothetical protein